MYIYIKCVYKKTILSKQKNKIKTISIKIV